jgi:acetyl-CoA C-acetyltransferase
MRDVAIIGIGQIPVGEHWNSSLRQLAVRAIVAAMQDAGLNSVDALYVGNAFGASFSEQTHLGALVADYAGLNGIEAYSVEAADASGAAALRQGYLAVKSGLVDVALVVGVEKFTDKVGSGVDAAIATTGDSDYEAVQGLTASAQAALLMRRYMHEYHVPADGFAGFALTAHANGAGNRYAMFQKAIKPETYAKAEMVSDPLNMFDMAPNADGAAALVLTRRDLIPSNGSNPLVKVAGSAAAADTLALHDRKDPLFFDTAQISAGKAMKQVGLTLDGIDFFEYHDVFSIYAALQLEAVGFAIKGGGWNLAAEGHIGLKGRIPCPTMGGMKARGFPGGAAGVYQAVEAAIQLRGQAGKNQVEGARFGLIQSLGGPASTAVSHILERIE